MLTKWFYEQNNLFKGDVPHIVCISNNYGAFCAYTYERFGFVATIKNEGNLIIPRDYKLFGRCKM